MSLRDRAISGIKWSYASQFGREALQLATAIVLARLLAPSDFGLVAMLTVFTGFLSVFSDPGTSALVIREKELSPSLLSSILLVNLLVGAALTLVVYAAAPLVAAFYQQPRLTGFLRFLSLIFVISGSCVLHKAYLERHLKFRVIARIEIAATLVGAAAGIAAAVAGCGAWSLLYQTMATAAANALLLFCFGPATALSAFSWREARGVVHLGLNLTGFNALNYLSRNLDNLLIGKFLGSESLGYYSLAYRIMFYPLQSISAAIGRVMFPIYANLREDDHLVRELVAKVAGCIALVTFPLMAGVALLAGPFVDVVFGVAWMPVSLLLAILAPVGMIQSIQTSVGSLYILKERTRLLFWWGVVSGGLETLGFVFGMRWGVVGVATVYAALSALLFFPGCAIPLRLIDMPMKALLRPLWSPLANALIMMVVIAVVWLLALDRAAAPVALVVLVPAGVVSYLAACWLRDRSRLVEVVEAVRTKAC